jgi:glycosyltransferase involved in cell wall biosynthesis
MVHTQGYQARVMNSGVRQSGAALDLRGLDHMSKHATLDAPFRVAHVIAPAPVGGAEQVVLDLTEALAQERVEAHLIPLLDPDANQHPFVDAVSPLVPVHPVQVPPRAYRQERARVRALLRELGIAVVHTHGYRADVIGGSAARAEGVATVSTAHGFTGGGLRNRFYQWLQRCALRRCDRVVAVSEPLREVLKERGVADSRISVIPNARAQPRGALGSAAARRHLGLSDSGFHVGWVGRMSPEKGPDVMLDALRRVAESGRAPALAATFVGDGRERARLEERSRTGVLEGRVRWLGAVPNASRFLRAFDVLVLSSRSEGTPIVALEAMTLGVPLIATRVGGVPHLLGSGSALLVQPESPEELGQAIVAVLDDSEGASERARLASQLVKGRYSPASWARAHIKLYLQVVPYAHKR